MDTISNKASEKQVLLCLTCSTNPLYRWSSFPQDMETGIENHFPSSPRSIVVIRAFYAIDSSE